MLFHNFILPGLIWLGMMIFADQGARLLLNRSWTARRRREVRMLRNGLHLLATAGMTLMVARNYSYHVSPIGDTGRTIITLTVVFAGLLGLCLTIIFGVCVRLGSDEPPPHKRNHEHAHESASLNGT